MTAGARGTTIILPEARDAGEIGPRLTRLAGLEEGRGGTCPFRLLDSIDGTIRRSGRALIEAGGRLLLLGGADGALSQDVPRRPGLVGDLPEGALKAALHGVSPLRALMLRAEGTASCRDLRVLDEERKTVARLSLVTLRGAAPHGATIATVQGLRGYDAAFETIASEVANPDGRPAAASDLYRLLGAGEAAPEAGADAAILPGTPAFTVADDLLRGQLALARAREAGIAADWDTEFLHDYRVAFRRLRSVLALFRGVHDEAERAELRAATRALMARTGALRDLDVQLLDRAGYRAMLPGDLHDGLDLLFERIARKRTREQRRLAAWLRSAEYDAAMAALAARLSDGGRARGPRGAEPVAAVLRDLVRRRWRTTAAAARRLGPESADAEVHDLRIRAKKLRYLLEFAAPVFGAAELKPILRPLKALQEELGRFNDASVQSAALGRLQTRGAAGRSADLAIARSIGALTAILHQSKMAQRRRVDENLAAFTDADLGRRSARWLGTGEG